jgi:hypothetical protein
MWLFERRCSLSSCLLFDCELFSFVIAWIQFDRNFVEQRAAYLHAWVEISKSFYVKKSNAG